MSCRACILPLSLLVAVIPLLEGCRAEERPAPPREPEDSRRTPYLFLEGLGGGTLFPGEQRTLTLSWDATLGGGTPSLSLGGSSHGALSLLPSTGESTDTLRWHLLALSEGREMLHAELGGWWRDFPVEVTAEGEMRPGRQGSSRVGILGLPEGGRTWCSRSVRVWVLLDGSPAPEDSSLVVVDSDRDGARNSSFLLTSPGLHILTAEVLTQEEMTLYNSFAVEGYGSMRLSLFAGFVSGTTGRNISDLVLFAQLSFGREIGNRTEIALKVNAVAGKGSSARRKTLYDSGRCAFQNGVAVPLAGYEDVKDFAIKNFSSAPGLEVNVRALNEWHRIGVDCSQLLRLVEDYTSKSISIVINGNLVPSGVTEPVI